RIQDRDDGPSLRPGAAARLEEVRRARPTAPREDGRPGARIPRKGDRAQATRADEEVQTVGRAQVWSRAGPLPGESGEGIPQDPRERGRERGIHGEGGSRRDGQPGDQRAPGEDDETGPP